MLPAGKTSKPDQAEAKREATEEEEPILIMLALWSAPSFEACTNFCFLL